MSAGAYWDRLAARYQRDTHISTRHFHLGPLLPCATALGLLPDLPPGARCLEAGCGAGQNILVRADSHYCAPEVLDFCRAARIDFLLGVATTTTLRRHVEALETSNARRHASGSAGRLGRDIDRPCQQPQH